MCGITGFLINNTIQSRNNHKVVASMAKTLDHRGPDDSGTWVDNESGIALGHTRLSVIDTSTEGHQPMESFSGRYVIVYNGEIYNYKELKEKIEKKERVNWRGTSDTEVILALIEVEGLENALQLFEGMFAFALWDKKEQRLFLVRDRVGIKPLYYGWLEKTFVFGSELKAIKAHPDFNNDINREAVELFMNYSYVPAPYSIYNTIYKVLPGTYLTITTKETPFPKTPLSPQIYWSVKEASKEKLDIHEDKVLNNLEDLLLDITEKCMLSDVPLGAFLSGGIDSSTVVALMQKASNRPIKTFTIGFHDTGYDEAIHAKEVAAHLGTEHTEVYLSSKEALDVIPKLPILYDEPFADSSQIPTYLISQLAHQQVTVALSGDGGDELFGGYNRYIWAPKIWNKIKGLPLPVRKTFGKSLNKIPPQYWDKIADIFPSSLSHTIPRTFGEKVNKIASILDAASPEEIYKRLVSTPGDNSSLVLKNNNTTNEKFDFRVQGDVNFAEEMMRYDMRTYLPDDILTKVDRASMGVSLETRVPLLDHRLIEYALQLPLNYKVKEGQSKWILRQVLYKYVPQKLIERPKMGFAVPLDKWLERELKEWAETLLNKEKIKSQNFFDNKKVTKLWEEYKSGNQFSKLILWNMLIFQSWLEKENTVES
ncbi:MAG: asparagine synthase (glutamine-hydrolyzing) [Nitrospinae bacterium]|nr:asparagine synthase (glutamine-hydrolyzing) [Nitrospinota bacterium]